MKTPQPPKGNQSAPNKRNFKLTERQHRTCEAFAMRGKLWREDVDRIAGASNGPEIMRQLKAKGLTWCDRIRVIDRDGHPCEPGIYSIVGSGWDTLRKWGFL